jgi:hypothetical protein
VSRNGEGGKHGQIAPGPHGEMPEAQREGGVFEEHRRVKCPRVFP